MSWAPCTLVGPLALLQWSNSRELSSDVAALIRDLPGTKDVGNKFLYSSFSLGASATAVDSELSEQ